MPTFAEKKISKLKNAAFIQRNNKDTHILQVQHSRILTCMKSVNSLQSLK